MPLGSASTASRNSGNVVQDHWMPAAIAAPEMSSARSRLRTTSALSFALHCVPRGTGRKAMNDKISRLIAIVTVAGGLSASAALAADVNIGIHVNTPPPPVLVAPVPAVVITPPSITLAAPPPLVVVPSVPTVQYVPSGAVNLFVFGGRYYSFHNGHWFHAGHYN